MDEPRSVTADIENLRATGSREHLRGCRIDHQGYRGYTRLVDVERQLIVARDNRKIGTALKFIVSLLHIDGHLCGTGTT